MADRSGYIGRHPGDSSVIIARQTFEPTGIQTDFAFASGYTPGYLDVYLNGVRLIVTSDYTAADGNIVGLTTNAINGDILECVAYKALNVGSVTNANSNFDVAGQLSVTGISTFTSDLYVGGNAEVAGIASVGAAITMYGSSGIVSATQYYGDGSELTGITAGATLSAGSGSQRVVVTSLTSGTMTSAATDGDLSWNSSTNTLGVTSVSATNLTGALIGNVTGNVTGDASGSSGSCTGNAATATLATNASGLSGTPNITINNLVGVAATFSGVVTYEDVTNVDSIGIVTARSGVRVIGGGVTCVGVATFFDDVNIGNPTPNWASRLDVSGGTNQSAITASTTTNTYKGIVVLNSSGTDMFWANGQGNTMVAGEFVVGDSMPPTYEPVSNTQAWIHGDFDGAGTGLQVGNKAAAGSSDESVFIHLTPMSGGKGVLCQSDREGTYSSAVASSASFNLQLNSENSWVERLKITPKGGFLLSNGILVERCAINTTNPWSTTNDVSLDDGNVFLNTNNLGGTGTTIDITSSAGLNVDLAVGDMTSVTLITAVNATTAFINHITIGAAAVTESWVGGSAPTDGGNSGYDVYTFTIIKTAANTYVCIANQVKGS